MEAAYVTCNILLEIVFTRQHDKNNNPGKSYTGACVGLSRRAALSAGLSVFLLFWS